MPRQKKAHELSFQQHIADFLVREHRYGVLEQSDITDTEHFISEDQLWAFLTATQVDTLTKLTDDYGTDARDEVFKALRKELEHTPLWMLYRQGLPVRGLEFRLFDPKPRSAESAAATKHGENRSTVTAHRDDRIYLEGAYRGQVNGKIQTAYDERGRYEELSDLKYTDTGGIFDIMAVTVIQHHLSFAA
jgi:hypothetical protein